jgi:hypothetical protein
MAQHQRTRLDFGPGDRLFPSGDRLQPARQRLLDSGKWKIRRFIRSDAKEDWEYEPLRHSAVPIPLYDRYNVFRSIREIESALGGRAVMSLTDAEL